MYVYKKVSGNHNRMYFVKKSIAFYGILTLVCEDYFDICISYQLSSVTHICPNSLKMVAFTVFTYS